MELDDELWSAFFAETDEHLEVLERLLGATPWQPSGIAAAFRAMHSLKGLAQAVALPNMQLLAHHAEDLLGLVRAGEAALDASVVQVLLATTDRLRVMREFVLEHGSDAPADAPLASWLDRVVRDVSVVADVAPVAAAGPLVPLADDAEMLDLYCDLLEEQAPSLVALLSDDPAARQLGRDHAEALANGADVMGFEQLASDLLALAVPTAAPVALSPLYELRGQLSLIEEMNGRPAGGIGLGAALARAAALDATQCLRLLRVSLGEADHAAILAAARRARSAFAAAERPHAASLLLRLEDALAQTGEGEIDGPDLRERGMAMIAGLPDETDIDAAAATSLLARWADPDQASAPTGSMPLEFRAELRAVLTPPQLALLARRIGEGAHAYTLLLDLEAGEIAADVIAWLSASVEVVTNCTVSVPAAAGPDMTASVRSWFEFLILSERSPEQLQAQVFALDPDQVCVHDLQPVLRDTRSRGAAENRRTPEMARVPAATPVIRVRVETIDRLMDEVSELRVALGALGETMRSGELASDLRAMRRQVEHLALTQEVQGELLGRLRNAERGHSALCDLQETLEGLQRQVWGSCMELRVVPADSLFGRFPRLVRELSQRLGKEVELEIEGREVRLDKSTADLLVDPLMHMIRNALDHGVEPVGLRLAAGKPRCARLVLAAAEQGDGIAISLSDDGAGLDRAAILSRAVARGLVAAEGSDRLADRDVFDFLFRPGFSTAETVSETSGRGVGLDVVAAVVERLDGRIDLETEPGRGTRFVLALPSSASLQNVLLVRVPQTLAIPERDVVAALDLSDAMLDEIGPQPVVWYQEAPVPLVSLASLLGLGEESMPDRSRLAAFCAVIVTAGRERLALLVDTVPQRRELFLKELHPLLARLPAVAGAAVLGNGQPVLVLDVAGLLSLARAPVAAFG